jgi:hypothetical protein
VCVWVGFYLHKPVLLLTLHHASPIVDGSSKENVDLLGRQN